jgi:pimeloyl-ACP methyl ester carboxylesterase
MKPVILLVPGMLNDQRIWSDVVQGLGDTAQIHVVDVLTQDNMADMARDAWALLANVPAGVPVVLAGFSMGGYVVMEMLSQAHRPLHGVAFLSTSPLPESPEGLIVRQKTMRALQNDFAKTVGGILPWSTHQVSETVAQDLREMMLSLGSGVAVRQTQAIMGRADHRPVLAALTCPVRLLCGQQDRVTPPELIRALADLIPHAQCEVVADCGHLLPREKPDVVIHHLRQLLA